MGRSKLKPRTPCELCGRVVPKGFLSRHHCVPKGTRGPSIPGDIARLCLSCHKMVHHIYTHRTLRAEYATVAALRAAPALQEFISWVKTRPATEVIKFDSPGPRL